MNKNEYKGSFVLAVCMLTMILLSLISSVALFKDTSMLQVDQRRSETSFFMRQYEYELLRTNSVFMSLYENPDSASGHQMFNKWFDILWSRVDGMQHGDFGKMIVTSGVKVTLLKKHLDEINTLIYSSIRPSALSYDKAKSLFDSLVNDSHDYQLRQGTDDREMELIRQQTTNISYRNSIFLSTATFIIALFIVFYLIRNNSKLLNLRKTLEHRVMVRTKELKDSNALLTIEIEERVKTEEQLKNSKEAAEEAKSKVIFQANYDALTRLANRSLFKERFLTAIDDAKRNRQFVALLFLDLDRFKHVNDMYGHGAGDDLLKEVSVRLKNILRETDTAARFGGDEFAVIITELDNTERVDVIANRILTSMAVPFIVAKNEAFVSASIGISVYPSNGHNCELLMHKADSAMYKAKEKGKNNFQYFTKAMDEAQIKRRKLEIVLHKALENNEFSLLYQPIMDVNNLSTVGCEVLLQWQHPQFGIVPANEFIALAEEVGLIVPIGEWVIRNACEQAAKWNRDTDERLYLSVNISSRQFQYGNMHQVIAKILQDTQLDPQLLMLEITESLLLSDDAHVLEQFNYIRELGIGLAIDDFGTGFSSLSYLRKFPINVLKIDQSFIQGIGANESDGELIQGIISMAHSLNLKVIAEGVESEQQFVFLARSNCLYIQGFYYSRALSAAKMSDFLSQQSLNS
ncbi:EAL domain-containing protein [Gammaproteobacteria bacterium AS21]